MGASLVKNCFLGGDSHEAPAQATPLRKTPDRAFPHRVHHHHSHHQQLHRAPARLPQHRILPPQPGHQPYALDRGQYRNTPCHYELQQREWYATERLKHRSPVKPAPRERWDSRESTCSSSASTDDEMLLLAATSDAAAHHQRRHRRSSRNSKASVAPEDSFYSVSTHTSSVSGSSSARSSSARRSRVCSSSLSLQTLLPENYVLEDLLGSGTTSKCYRCRRTTDNRVFACKIINKRWLAFDHHPRDDMVSQLRREVDILKSLDHPNITKLEDAFENDTYIALVMELLDGGELFECIIDRVKLDEKEAKLIARSLLSAISYIHAKGIVHRDIKPENMLLATKATPGSPLQVKIIDFGFASTSNKPMTSVLGTGGYLAPEIVMQRPYTEAVDTWSFGVLLYLMLCGRLPFTTATQLSPGQRASSVYRLTFPDKYWAGVSPLARNLLQKLLVLNPADRLSPRDALHHPWFHVA